MNQRLNDIYRALVNWHEDDRTRWEERAAVLEYDEGLPRDEAEEKAFWQLLKLKRERGKQ